jgi:hypothetical protein
MKFTIEEEKRGDKITFLHGVLELDDGLRHELSGGPSSRPLFDAIALAINSHDPLVAALKLARERLRLADEIRYNPSTMVIIDAALTVVGAA